MAQHYDLASLQAAAHPAASVPAAVLAQVDRALARLHDWNTVITDARRMEAVAHQPGRYEYDCRYSVAGAQYRAALVQARQTLATFEALAATHGITAQTVYARLGGLPVLLAEGPDVAAWRPTQEDTR